MASIVPRTQIPAINDASSTGFGSRRNDLLGPFPVAGVNAEIGLELIARHAGPPGRGEVRLQSRVTRPAAKSLLSQ